MKIELMIYVYVAICVSMIFYNIVYAFILIHRENSLYSNSKTLEELIIEQIELMKKGEVVTNEHKSFLCRRLDFISGITAFDKALSEVYKKESEFTKKYLGSIFSVFEYLTMRYINKDTIKVAYFPYLLHKYKILSLYNSEQLIEVLLGLLRSKNVYCRENSLKALYCIGDPDIVIKALKIIDQCPCFHHSKLITDGMMEYKGDREALKNLIFEKFDEFSVTMQVNVLNFIRFSGIRCDDVMLSLLTDEEANMEIRFCAIRYFEKFPSDTARDIIFNLAENKQGRVWEYQAIASSALKSYPGEDTFSVLVKNLSSSNWHVRQNSAISCVKLGYTYQDLINVFDGNDRYAREIIRYRLDRKNAESEALKV